MKNNLCSESPETPHYGLTLLEARNDQRARLTQNEEAVGNPEVTGVSRPVASGQE